METFHKQKIRVTSGMLEYSTGGGGSPSIVLINGSGGPIEGWYKVFHKLAKTNTVIAYNRFGIGGSGMPSEPQHGQTIVHSLKELLAAANVQPPYVLVGHSLGGLYANLFARQHADETAAVVLLESTHPLDLTINQLQGGLTRRINRLLALFDSRSTNKLWLETQYVEETVRQLGQALPFPDVPLVVVSGGKKPLFMPQMVHRTRANNQSALVRLSSQGRQVTAARSGHFPQLSEPEIVIDAVHACLLLSKPQG